MNIDILHHHGYVQDTKLIKSVKKTKQKKHMYNR